MSLNRTSNCRRTVASKTAIARAFGSSHKEAQKTQKEQGPHRYFGSVDSLVSTCPHTDSCPAIPLCLLCLFVASKTAIACDFLSSHKEAQKTQEGTETASFLQISRQPRLNVFPYRFQSCDFFVTLVSFRGQQNCDCACLCF